MMEEESGQFTKPRPTGTERKSLIQECGWKGGDSGDSAEG
jgi:hypothetical protein